MTKAKIAHHILQFIRPGGTSRGVMTTKDSWFLQLMDEIGKTGTGEIGFLKGLSSESEDSIKKILAEIVNDPDSIDYYDLKKFPSVNFAVEQAKKELSTGKKGIYYESDFTNGLQPVKINGLIWMGTKDYMRQQVKEKLEKGFQCIKIKIGAIDFEEETELLRSVRNEFSKDIIELRVDANGAFSNEEAMEKLNRLAQFDLHSIEQPIKAGQWVEMRKLCEESPVPIALDEELIGVTEENEKRRMIEAIRPHFLVLKPSLLGGFSSSEEWIRIADENNAGWWVTSALESNIGLNAIAQWTATLQTTIPQGLGTGQLYSNNFESPLELKNDELWFNPQKKRETPFEN